MTPLLSVTDARVQIGEKEIIAHGSLSAQRGELVAIVGPNGAGKSTLVRAAAGMQRLAGGSVQWDGVPVAALRGRKLARVRAFVPQRSLVPEGVRVHEAVAIGRSAQIGPLRAAGAADREAVTRSLERCGVLEMAERHLTTLSGGELQRVQIAVALAQEAPALIADEPTSHLDLGGAAEMAVLLRALADQGLAVILVLHDLALAAAIADRVVVMSRGRTVADGHGSDALTPERLAEVWGIGASLTFPASGQTALRVDWLGGDPSAASRPTMLGATPPASPLKEAVR